MRILQYNLTTTTKLGGVETFVWELSAELARRGHALTLLGGATPDFRLPIDDLRLGRASHSSIQNPKSKIEVLRLPFVDRTVFQRLPPLRRMYVLVKLLERASMMPAALPLLGGYDVVHLHKPYDLLLAPLLARGRGMHGPTRVVLHSHGEDFFPGDRLLIRWVSAVLSCSRFNAAYTSARYGRQAQVVYNGFDAAHFAPQPPDLALRDALLPREHAALLCVARLEVPWKGVDDLIAALARLPERTTLLVAGEGRQRAALVRQALAAGLGERVRFLGAVPNRELPRYYALADLVVGASYASETFGMALCEAMGCARPVVATRFGGFPEVVEEGVTGLLAPPRDPPALAAASGALLADPPRRAAMGAAGRERALRLFTWPAVADRVEAAYHAIVHRREAERQRRRKTEDGGWRMDE
jgi:glycosyltransferase involved in cell wall biosynthesis